MDSQEVWPPFYCLCNHGSSGILFHAATDTNDVAFGLPVGRTYSLRDASARRETSRDRLCRPFKFVSARSFAPHRQGRILVGPSLRAKG